MEVVGVPVLRDFVIGHAGVKSQVQAWVAEARSAEWRNPQDVKSRYASASFLSGNRIVFNLKGKKYRLLVTISYQLQIVRINRIGTHSEYDRWKL